MGEQTIDETLPVGWTVPVAYNFNNWLAVAGEVGANYKSNRILGQDLDLDVNTTQFALQPGGGIDVSIADNVAIRFQGDYRAILADRTLN